MNLNENQPQTLLVNLDLFFDFYSVLFSAYRTHFAKEGISINNLKHCIEGKNLNDGLTSLVNEASPGLDVQKLKEELLPLLDISLACIKPTISVYTLVKSLTKNGIVIKTFTNFEDDVVKHIKDAHKNWFNYEIKPINGSLSVKELLGDSSESNTIFINSSVESCLVAKREEDVRTVFIPHSKKVLEGVQKDDKIKETLETSGVQICEGLENIDWNQLGVKIDVKYPDPSYFLQLDTKPINNEYQIWTNVSKLKEPIELTSEIVHGFGRGGKKLGIPTANLDMTPEIQAKMEDLVSGVYYGWAEFLPSSSEMNNKDVLEYNRKQPMVMSIGFNPYFNNKHKTAEAHIMNKFEGDFYASTLKVQILGFIRTEADFIKFSHLIEAIHNDVQVAKDILSAP